MDRNTSRHIIFISTCAALGIIVGGMTSRIELNSCLAQSSPSPSCLLQDPTVKTVEGMSFGLLAGIGSAVSIAWQVWREENKTQLKK